MPKYQNPYVVKELEAIIPAQTKHRDDLIKLISICLSLGEEGCTDELLKVTGRYTKVIFEQIAKNENMTIEEFIIKASTDIQTGIDNGKSFDEQLDLILSHI